MFTRERVEGRGQLEVRARMPGLAEDSAAVALTLSWGWDVTRFGDVSMCHRGKLFENSTQGCAGSRARMRMKQLEVI